MEQVTITAFEELVEGVAGLTLGYIGNCSSHFDDRCWYIWTETKINDGFYAGNCVDLWCGTGPFTRGDFNEAARAVRTYKLGLAARS